MFATDAVRAISRGVEIRLQTTRAHPAAIKSSRLASLEFGESARSYAARALSRSLSNSMLKFSSRRSIDSSCIVKLLGTRAKLPRCVGRYLTKRSRKRRRVSEGTCFKLEKRVIRSVPCGTHCQPEVARLRRRHRDVNSPK